MIYLNSIGLVIKKEKINKKFSFIVGSAKDLYVNLTLGLRVTYLNTKKLFPLCDKIFHRVFYKLYFRQKLYIFSIKYLFYFSPPVNSYCC